MDQIESYKKAAFARQRVIELGYACGKNGAHFGSSLSLIDLLTCLYATLFTAGKSGAYSDERARFVLSKGHGALGYFSILEAFGFLSKEQTDLFEVNGSNFFAHAHKNISNGIEFSGGSLGLGVSFGVGIAIANKLKENNSEVLVLVGDGECDEGIVWEALMSAANYRLNNFTIIIDRNMMQSDGKKSLIMDHQDICEKVRSFGFDVHEVDGHNHLEINKAILATSNAPKAIVANTVKGYGVSFMESNESWHHGTLRETQFTQAMEELRGN